MKVLRILTRRNHSIEIFLKILDELLNLEIQLVILGSGEKKYETP